MSGNKSPKMADIARAAGVSSMTVSRAFRNDASVGAKTRDRILMVADEMGYVLDTTASALRSQKTSFVAVTVPSINNPNFADTVGALAEVLAGHDLQVLLGFTNYDVQVEETLLRQFMRRKPEAVVVTGGVHTPKARTMLKALDVPVVETWDVPADPIDLVVGFSNADAGAQIVDHFVSLGLTRMGFIGGSTQNDTRGQDRKRGFIARLESLGLDARRAVSVSAAPTTVADGANAMDEMLRQWPDTQAVMCVADSAAFGAMTQCQRRGLRVPEDIAIAGFGAFEIGAFAIPPITTLEPDAKRIGRVAAQLIAARLAGETSARSNTPVILSPRVIARGSTVG